MDPTKLEGGLIALGIDPRHARDGFRAQHPFVVALHMAALGYRVIPCNVRKIPHIESWQHRASREPRTLIQWERGLFESYKTPEPHSNWSVLAGAENGLVIVDEDCIGEVAILESKLGKLVPTWTVESGRGRHLWYRTSTEEADYRTVSRVLGAGVDIRGWHGHAVLPGSMHKSGNRYRWADGHAPDEIEIAELPLAWREALPKHVESGGPVARSVRRVSKARGSVEHDPGSYLIGDGPGFGGFQNPIYRNAIRYFFKAGIDAPESIIIDTLREMIAEAPKGVGRDTARYMDGNDLPRIVERAREYVKEVKENERDGFEYEPDGNPG